MTSWQLCLNNGISQEAAFCLRGNGSTLDLQTSIVRHAQNQNGTAKRERLM
jgi:hypothetical protein